MNTIPRHAEPEIDAFLAIGGYASIEDWMRDSDYTEDTNSVTGWLYEGEPIWPTDAIAGAMEACHEDDELLLAELEDALANPANGSVAAALRERADLYRKRLGSA